MATITYQIRGKRNPTNIYLRLTTDRKTNIRRKTGYVIDPNDWSSANKLPKPKDEDLKKLKNDLGQLKVEIEKKLNAATSNGTEITGDWLQQSINESQGKVKKEDSGLLSNCISDYIKFLPHKKQRNGKRGVSNSTLKKYKSLQVKIEEYEKYRKRKIMVKEVGLKFIEEIDKYLVEVDLLGANTVGRYIKFIKTVCLWAVNDKGVVGHSQLNRIKGYSEQINIITLSFEELKKIEEKEFEKEALDNARDWLIIGCYIGQRVSDLLNLNSKNLTIVSGMEMISVIQKKGEKPVLIPIHNIVKSILNKRNGKFPRKISDQRFNDYIKDVCKTVDISELTKGSKMMCVNEEANPKVYRKIKGKYKKWELITSHICRRSFATNFYGEIPTSLLKDITAHSTEKQFLEYIGKSSSDSAVQIAEYWQRQSLEKYK